MKTDDIRRKYLDFFKSKGHELIASDSLVPKDDPSLLFTGAGMNQFKDKFLGRNVTYKRAATSQKCLRTGDLENVGRTSTHHTFFEMLGNFSFGDYFKKEAIAWAWELFTRVFMIPEEKLWVSVYKDDDEAYNIWRDDIKIPDRKIVRLGEKDNFWPSEAPSKGPNGPCGPCSEIFYDYGLEGGCGKEDCTPACDCGRFVEVWNLVFTQFERLQDGMLKPLPNKNIDTGMGLERIASVLQGVRTNFDIDIFKPIVENIKKLSLAHGDKTFKVNAIADHIRAVSFCILDGVMPSNEARGYVARKLIRRALSHGQDIGIKGPFLYKLVSIVSEVMGGQYPELKVRRDDIAMVVKTEEEAFLFVLANQMPKVDEAFSALKKSGKISGVASTAFNFYDTYGMPYDMLEEIAQRYDLKIDEKEFGMLLDKQRDMSRAKSKIKGEIFTETFSKKVEALALKTEFTGYDILKNEAKVLAVMDRGEIILDKTPFYGESGGQAGDKGLITSDTGVMEVNDAKSIAGTVVHIGMMKKGVISLGQKVLAEVDEISHKNVMANHTATHLLQAALRKVLGDHVHQTGSHVDDKRLRFDFTHMKKMEPREIARVEEIINCNIAAAVKVGKEIRDIDDARRDGATALFGEKYDKMVRVVTIKGISKELCGGTHIDNTRDIGFFKVISEGSAASGVRRIEALTGERAREWVRAQEEAARTKMERDSVKDQEKAAYSQKINAELSKTDLFISRARDAGGVKVIIEEISGVRMDGLRLIADKLRAMMVSGVVILSVREDEKISFIVTVSEDLIKRSISANVITKQIAKIIDGSGGGKDAFAQGGGKAADKFSIAIESILAIVKEAVK